MKTVKEGMKWLDWLAFGGLMLVILAAYTTGAGFNKMIAHAGPIICIMLLILFANHVDWIQALKNRDKEFMLLLIVGTLAVINMLLSKAGPGVLFDIANLVLIIYLADKVILDDKILYMVTVVYIFILLYFFIADPKGYNPNTHSMIVFEACAVSTIGVSVLSSKIKKIWLTYIYVFITFLCISIPISMKYRGRTTIVGILVLISFFVVPGIVWNIKRLYKALWGVILLFSTMMPMLVLLYMAQGREIPYRKYWINGREIAWEQYMGAWLKEPWTGIGNDYLAKIPNLRYDNVHNGAIHILTVYGVFIFIIVIILLGKKLLQIKTETMNLTKRFGLCLLVSMFVISIMETYVVISFSNILFLLAFISVFREDGGTDTSSSMET